MLPKEVVEGNKTGHSNKFKEYRKVQWCSEVQIWSGGCRRPCWGSHGAGLDTGGWRAFEYRGCSCLRQGKQIRTGSLGDVMQESIQAALTVVRSRSESLGIDLNYFDEHDVHVHVPEGLHPRMDRAQELGCARRWCLL